MSNIDMDFALSKNIYKYTKKLNPLTNIFLRSQRKRNDTDFGSIVVELRQ